MKYLAKYAACAIALAAISPNWASAQTNLVPDVGEPSRLYITLDRSIEVPRDQATISVTVSARRDTGPQAAQYVRTRYDQILAIIRAAVPDENDLTTSALTVGNDTDEYDFQRPGTARPGVNAAISVTVLVRDLRVMPGLFAALSDTPDVSVGSPTFLVSNRAEISRQLRRDLLNGALAEANQYADAAGMHVIRLAVIGADWINRPVAGELLERRTTVVEPRIAPGPEIFAGTEVILESNQFAFDLGPN